MLISHKFDSNYQIRNASKERTENGRAGGGGYFTPTAKSHACTPT